MARHKLNQVPLVKDQRPTQPPFPGGWVLAVFEALANFAPDLARRYEFSVSGRTLDRIRAGESVKRGTYEEMEAKLAQLVSSVFPRVSKTSKCIERYVREYFDLWRMGAEFAPQSEASLGSTSGESVVLVRALIRDWILRMGYLECLERALGGADLGREELSLLQCNSPAAAYQELIQIRTKDGRISQEALAGKLGVEGRTLRRFKTGQASPTLVQLEGLSPASGLGRLIVGMGFTDHLFRSLRLHGSPICHEVFALALEFLPRYRQVLEDFALFIPQEGKGSAQNASPCDVGDCIAYSEHLFLHPGFDRVLTVLSRPIWRCHLYSLAFGRMHDLSRAYLRLAKPEHDEGLTRFLEAAERETGDCPFRWMTNLDRASNILRPA